jgi:hypothetical protein
MKNTMLIPLVTITFFSFGWWIYFALPNGPGITEGLVAAPWAEPWSKLMGPHISGKPATAAPTADDTMGWAKRSFIMGIRLCPPAKARPSSPCSPSNSMASSTDPGLWYSKLAGNTFPSLLVAAPGRLFRPPCLMQPNVGA